MNNFQYSSVASRVIFGHGTIENLNDEIDLLGGQKILVLTTPFQKDLGEKVVKQIGARAVGLYANATMHTPLDVTQDAIAFAKERDVDLVIAIGGGSTIGLGKALSLHAAIPQIAIPTTYAGSEMTPILGQTENGKKTTIRDDVVRPKTVIYDVDLTIGLPVDMSVTSGLNAIAHAMEALYAKDANPIISLMAEEGIRALASALPKLRTASDDKAARSDALYGAWLCSQCLASVGMSLHHKLCHTLGGSFNLPHAETHSVILPYAAAYNAPAAPEAMSRIARALGREDNNGAQALFDLTRKLNAPASLATLNMPETGIERAVEIALSNPYWNPREIEESAIRLLLTNAWHGNQPTNI